MQSITQFGTPRGAIVSWGLIILLGTSTKALQAETPATLAAKYQQIVEGRKLFEHDWEADGPVNHTGDGLGPVYNDVSCVACHQLGGTGGAGPDEKNVELLSIVRRNGSPRSFRNSRLIKNAQRIHPAFSEERQNVILHHFGRDADGSTGEYAGWRRNLTEWGRFTLSPRSSPSGDHPSGGARAEREEKQFRKIDGIWVHLARRNPPALFGAGIIDAIPDTVFIQTAERQAEKHPDISGRVPQAPSGAVGRFGWRGQTATLHDFVLQACADELGLQVPGRSQAMNPLNPNHRPKGLDLTDEQCDALTTFVASLPAPEPVKQRHLAFAREVLEGEQLFEEIGCAACHVKHLGPARNIYSDLLLHDMGSRLADPVAAVPELSADVSFSNVGYSGGFVLQNEVQITTNIQQEWRTPPLWGVRDSAPYLHDGRADTLEEAVRWHGGEARRAAREFRRLRSEDQQKVIAFLNSLVAPGGEPNRFGTGVPSGGIDFIADPAPPF